MRITKDFYRIKQLIKCFIFAAAILFIMTGAKLTVLADGSSITSPAADAEFEAGKKVTIKVKSPGGDFLMTKYIYYRITRTDPDNVSELVLTDKKGFIVSQNVEISFTPDKEGYYKIEVYYTTDSSLEDFEADDSRTIRVWKNISGAEVAGITDKVYTGQEQTQSITVTLGERALTLDTDYQVTYSDNINTGTAGMTITGTGFFYKGTITKSFNITGKPIPENAVSAIADEPFTNKQIKPEPEVIVDGVTLTKGTDYELNYGQNVNVGEPATVTVTGIGNYSGEITKNFNIVPVSIRRAIIAAINDRKYTGTPIEPYPSVKYNGYGISKDIDFTMTYSDNINPGTATIVFTGIGNFKDSVTRTFTILEPTNSGGGLFTSVILEPNDKTEYPVGAEISVKAKATNFYYNYYAGTPINRNYIYFKVSRDGEEVHFTNAVLTPDTVDVTMTFKADVAGVYLIQTEWDDCEVDSNGHYTAITSETFSPDTSIQVYVGTPAPAGGVKDISNATITGLSDKAYTGNAITQSLTVKDGDKTLIYGTDYYLTYLNNVDVGPAAVKVHGKGNYTGTTDYMTFQITKCPLSSDMINLSADSFTYNGKTQLPAVTVKHGTFTLDEGIEYTVENAGGIEPGDYVVTITAVDGSNYTGTASKTYKIKGISIADAVVTTDPASFTYDGSAMKPAVSVTLNGEILPDETYTVAYTNNTNAGTAQAVITAKDGSPYEGSASGTFTIGPCDINSENISIADIAGVTYNRTAQTPVPSVTFGEMVLQADTDFTLEYSANTNAGTANVTITGKGNFKGSRTTAFTINSKDISDATVTVDKIAKQLYVEGSPSEPAVTVKDGDAILTSEEYSVEYSKNTAPGTATVTITGKGNYTGSRNDVTFEILERTDYAEDSLKEKVDELEKDDTTQYLLEDDEELKKAIEEAKKILDDDKSDADALEKALEKIKKAKEKAEENLKSLPTPEAVEKAILADKKDNDPKGSDFAKLQLKSSKQGKNYITLQWTNVSGATKYIIYGGRCGKKIKQLDTVTNNKYTCKGLKKGKYYKYIVVAVIDTSMGEKAAGVSKMIHVTTKGGKNGNDKSVTVKIKSGKKKKAVTKVTVKKGKKLTLYASSKPESKKLKVKKHIAIRFESTDTKIATISKKGVITGKAKGSCYVYAYAQNGVYKKIKVTVK